jgi:HK97 family phage major capsid protein
MDNEKLLDSVSELLAKELKNRDEQIKLNGETNRETGEKVDKLHGQYEELQNEIKEANVAGNRPGGGGGSPAKSVGEQFTDSDAYRQAREMNLKTTDAVEVKAADLLPSGSRSKALDSTDTGGQLLGETTYDRNIRRTPDEFFTMRGIMSTQNMTGGSMEWIEESGWTNAAAVVPEGGLKPESLIDFTRRDSGAKTIAHGIAATNQVLADASQLRGHIDYRLRYGLQQAEEQQILYGSGTGDNYQGLLTHARRQQMAVADGQAGDTLIDLIRRAFTRVRLAEYPVQGGVIHPQRWEEIELLKGSDGRYLISSYNEGGQMRFFRVPFVESTAIQVDDVALGAFRLAATLFTREAANIRVFEQHADFARRNMVYIRAEMRGLLANYRPEAFVHLSLAATP